MAADGRMIDMTSAEAYSRNRSEVLSPPIAGRADNVDYVESYTWIRKDDQR